MNTTFKTAWNIRQMNDDEFLAHMRLKSPEERHVTMCLSIGDTFKSAKSGRNLDGFERDYLRLKSYMVLHRWSKEFILSRFGVSFKAITRLYFQCVNSPQVR